MNSPFQPVPMTGMPPGGQPVYPPGQPVYQPGMMPPGFNPAMPGATPFQQPGMAPYPGAPVNSQTGGMTGVPIGAFPPQPGASQGRSGPAFGGGTFGGGSFGGGSFGGGQASGPFPGGRTPGGMVTGGITPGGMMQGQQGMMRPGMGPGQPGMPGAQQNPALQMINQILTGQRQNPAMRGGGVGGQNLGGGVAGIASKKDAEGIRIYKERTNYKEWEFIYDPKEEAAGQMAKQGMPGATGNQQTPNIPGVPTLNQGAQPGAQPVAPKQGPAFGFGRQ
jgi:hypothetical protein